MLEYSVGPTVGKCCAVPAPSALGAWGERWQPSASCRVGFRAVHSSLTQYPQQETSTRAKLPNASACQSFCQPFGRAWRSRWPERLGRKEAMPGAKRSRASCHPQSVPRGTGGRPVCVRAKTHITGCTCLLDSDIWDLSVFRELPHLPALCLLILLEWIVAC